MTEARILSIVDDYAGLVAALRSRIDELEIAVSSDNAADLSGLGPQYLAKLMTPETSGRVLAMTTLGPVLGLLGLKLHVVEDEDQTRRMKRRIERRCGYQVRSQTVQISISQKTLKETRAKGGRNSRKGMRPSDATKLAKRAARHRHHPTQAAKRSFAARVASLARWAKWREARDGR